MGFRPGFDAAGNLYIADGFVVRKVASDGTITTVAGNGAQGSTGDGPATVEAVERYAIDLVILDQDMPRLTGLGVLEELRAQFGTAGTPIIMLTARTDDTESQAFELGAQDYLTKPFQPRSLLARVRAVLKRTAMD